MDTRRIIQNDGYTFDDLTDENKEAIRWLRFLEDQVDSFEANYLLDLGDSILNKIRKENAEELFEDLKEWISVEIAEIQISMIENQDDV